MNTLFKTTIGALAGAAISATAAFGAAHEAVKFAFIEPLSGPFAATGTNGADLYTFSAERLVNEKGGVLGGRNFEIVTFDSKASPKEALIQLQVAIDQGIKFIVQGNSSGVANALTDAIAKHNRRNPENRVMFLNYSAVDPALTNDKCNFWHYRFDAHADIKMDALTDVMAADESIKKVYIVGQDYSFGKAVAAGAVKMLGEKRPDIEIVGNELHPIGKVKDFTPYARKINASGADAVITGNWGSDMLGIGKAILENGYTGPIYTYYAAADGITAAFGEKGKGSLRLVAEGPNNADMTGEGADFIVAFKEKYPEGNVSQPRIANVMQMIAKAIEAAGTADDVAAIGSALEGMKHQSIWGGELYMRPQDHQIIQNVNIFEHTDIPAPFDFDNSGYGLKYESTVENASADIPTTCKMKRP